VNVKMMLSSTTRGWLGGWGEGGLESNFEPTYILIHTLGSITRAALATNGGKPSVPPGSVGRPESRSNA